ncbi:MAG: dihydrolipoyllysine-residue acetyltransferase component of pyruvate dehydrogenase complex [Phycisphaerae bacterium]|nr:MAG: dihydrolipoyllysine-residue acetyltransferase component of pyruvate dehydrogenase complex [Phycisphaerae bacterium]
MPIEVTMPRLSDTMQQGTIVKWNVKEGQAVKSGDVIADIETDKATMELQSFDDGVVASLPVAAGQSVPVGTVIMLIAAKGEDLAAVKASAGKGAVTVKAGSPASSAGAGATATAVAAPAGASNGHTAGTRVFASPLAKKIAEESGVDLSRVQGSGPGGRIVRKDVEEALTGGTASRAMAPTNVIPPRAGPESRAPQGLADQLVPLSNMRRIIASRLVESKTTIPHYQVTVDVDMDALMGLRGQLNEQLADQGVKLSVNDFLVRACALAMHQHPYVNARWVDQGATVAIQQLAGVNIGVAIALPMERGGGLVVGTIRGADSVGLRQISAESKRLGDKARAKGLSPEEMSDSTFTISNLGMFGVSHFTAIINPPNAAILAVGAAVQRAVVKNGQVVPGYVMSMTMSSDHRVIDGAMAAQYLATVKGYLEKPATLLV